MSKFSSLGLSQAVVNAIGELGFVEPTAIQLQAIPRLLKNDTDLVGLAQTGTGKTAAFGLPLIELVNSDDNHTQALILAPTRELCMQITNDLHQFAKYLKKLQITPVYGGADISRQMREVRKGAQIIVATPGRLRDLMRRKSVRLDQVKYVVLDEADEMLNMGFKEEIDDILKDTPKEKQTWLFSATMPIEVRRISESYMSNPFELSIGEKNSSNDDIDHQYVIARPSERYPIIKRFMDFAPDTSALIFCRTRNDSRDLAEDLVKDGYNADALHGDLNQAQRDRVMNRFRSQNLQILVATDVAARGIDVQDINYVFHFNIPDDLSYYTHRSGRTGRAGNKGISLVLAHPREMEMIRRLERKLKVKFTRAHIPTGNEICERRLLNHIHKIKEADITEEIDTYLPMIREELESISKEDLIKKISSLSFDRFLKAYRYAPDLNPKTKGRFQGKRLFINIGEMDVKSTGEFLGMICEHCGITSSSIGKIEMQRTHTFFDVEESLAPQVMHKFKGCNFEDRPIRVNAAEGDHGSPRVAGKRKRTETFSKFKKKGKKGKKA